MYISIELVLDFCFLFCFAWGFRFRIKVATKSLQITRLLTELVVESDLGTRCTSVIIQKHKELQYLYKTSTIQCVYLHNLQAGTETETGVGTEVFRDPRSCKN